MNALVSGRLTRSTVKAGNTEDIGGTALSLGVDTTARLVVSVGALLKSRGSEHAGEESGDSEELHFDCRSVEKLETAK